MSLKLLTIVLLGIGFMVAAPVANAIPIINGSFELDRWAGYQYDLEISGLTGWVASDPGDASPLYPWGINEAAYGNTPWGDQFVVIGGYGADMGTSIQQTVAGLTIGQVYTLSFGLASEGYAAGGFAGNANVQVSMVAGSSTVSAVYSPVLSVNNYWDTWAMYSYAFTANATSATFAFEDLAMTETGYDVGIDNVSFSGAVVPEPTTLLLLCAGLGMLGLVAYRRSN